MPDENCFMTGKKHWSCSVTAKMHRQVRAIYIYVSKLYLNSVITQYLKYFHIFLGFSLGRWKWTLDDVFSPALWATSTLWRNIMCIKEMCSNTQQVNLSLSTFCSKNCLKLGKTYRVLLCKYQLPCIIIVHFARIASWLEYYQEGKHWTTILSLLENFSHIT